MDIPKFKANNGKPDINVKEYNLPRYDDISKYGKDFHVIKNSDYVKEFLVDEPKTKSCGCSTTVGPDNVGGSSGGPRKVLSDFMESNSQKGNASELFIEAYINLS